MKAIPKSRYLLFCVIAVVGTFVDLATKTWIFDRQWPDRRVWPFAHYVSPDGLPLTPAEIAKIRQAEPVFSAGDFELAWEISYNEGALFGVGQGLVWLFAGLSVLAFLGVVYWLFWLGEARSLWLCIALAGVTAGIFGNLYDRLALHGLEWPEGTGAAACLGREGEPMYAVRDWIRVRYGDKPWPSIYGINHWPNFNIADALLVCGAIMIAIEGVRDHRRRSKESDATGEETAAAG